MSVQFAYNYNLDSAVYLQFGRFFHILTKFTFKLTGALIFYFFIFNYVYEFKCLGGGTTKQITNKKSTEFFLLSGNRFRRLNCNE